MALLSLCLLFPTVMLMHNLGRDERFFSSRPICFFIYYIRCHSERCAGGRFLRLRRWALSPPLERLVLTKPFCNGGSGRVRTFPVIVVTALAPAPVGAFSAFGKVSINKAFLQRRVGTRANVSDNRSDSPCGCAGGRFLRAFRCAPLARNDREKRKCKLHELTSLKYSQNQINVGYTPLLIAKRARVWYNNQRPIFGQRGVLF